MCDSKSNSNRAEIFRYALKCESLKSEPNLTYKQESWNLSHLVFHLKMKHMETSCFMCMLNTIKQISYVILFICKPEGSIWLLEGWTVYNMSFFIANVGILLAWQLKIKKHVIRVRRGWGGRCLLIEPERFQHALQGVRVTHFTSDLSFEGHWERRKKEGTRERETNDNIESSL